ncbi:MAG: leucine-rich repeat domain-containing protein, partial [Ruminococcus sp.]|nr:leucine-rich repeat domain-containing protein [Ruminococcus sp.]
NLPQEFTDAGSAIYVYHYVTTKTYSNLIRTVTYETADGVKVWSQLVALGGMDASDNVQVMAQTAWTDLTNECGEVFIVGLTLTSQTGGVMDKTAAQIFEAFNQGKTVILTGTFGDQDISLKVITAAEGTLDETITLTAIAVTEPDGTLFHIYVPRGETNAFALHTYNLNALDGTTFYPSVSSEGVISWTNDGGKQNPAPVNIKGPAGNNYILTPQDKSDIADMVLEMLPPAQIADPALILWDWEGTKLAEYDRATALSLTALPAPGTLAPYAGVDHELLLFQRWDWSLANIKTWIQAHEGEALDVGASYTPRDGQNHNYWDGSASGSESAISVQKRGETTIADNAFQNYYSLRAISIPFGTTGTGVNVFWGCSALKHLVLPDGITSLNGGFIRNASTLKKVIIPDGVTTIGFGALLGCSSLEKLIIPDSVRTIEGSAFSGCYALNDLVMSKNLSGRIAGILQNCYVLPKFHINSGITSIGANTFANCRSLCDILMESKAGLENVNALSGLPSNYRIYVPRADLSWFETATNWSSIYDHFVAIEDYINYLESIGFNVDAYKEAA